MPQICRITYQTKKWCSLCVRYSTVCLKYLHGVTLDRASVRSMSPKAHSDRHVDEVKTCVHRIKYQVATRPYCPGRCPYYTRWEKFNLLKGLLPPLPCHRYWTKKDRRSCASKSNRSLPPTLLPPALLPATCAAASALSCCSWPPNPFLHIITLGENTTF